MTDTKEPRNLTSEVQQALRERGHVIPAEEPPITQNSITTVPDGHVRYHLAVGETILNGQAPVATVAAQLRMLADQIEKEQAWQTK